MVLLRITFQLLLTCNLGYRRKQTLKYKRIQQLATIYFFFPLWIWMKGMYLFCNCLIIKLNVIYNSGVCFFSVQMKNVFLINYIQGILVRKPFFSIEVQGKTLTQLTPCALGKAAVMGCFVRKYRHRIWLKIIYSVSDFLCDQVHESAYFIQIDNDNYVWIDWVLCSLDFFWQQCRILRLMYISV